MVSKMWPTPSLKIIFKQELNLYVKWSFFNRKNYNMWCFSRKCSGGPTVFSLYKRFAPSNIFFFTSHFADDVSFKVIFWYCKSNTWCKHWTKKTAKWYQTNRLTLQTKFIVFSNKNMHFDPNSVIYQLLIIDLKETESAKYLNKE